MKQTRFLLTVLLTAGMPWTAAGADPQPEAVHPGLEVSLSTQEDAVYPKRPLLVRMTFVNKSTDAVTLDAAAFAPDRFRVVDSVGKGPGQMKPGTPASQPLRIDGLETLEHQVDLSAWYPALTARPRVWEVTWSDGDLKPVPLIVKITRPYDRGKDRTAVVETELGRMVWRLMPEHAPLHVKHFVDLVRQGFYDGLTIYRATPGITAEGGDPKGDGTGGWDRLLMPEMSSTVETKMGLVGAMRRESSVTNNCIFFITLAPNAYMAGMQTFFAEVITGIEVVAKLYRVPNHGNSGDTMAYLLTPPVRIHRITISR